MTLVDAAFRLTLFTFLFVAYGFVATVVAAAVAVDIQLDRNWTVTNTNGSIALTGESLPSGIYSALERNGVIRSIFDDYNDVNTRWVAHENWTYAAKFEAPLDVKDHVHVLLVVHGVDTLANISLNGHWLGSTDNMFVRYRFDVADFIRAGENTLTVNITSPIHGAIVAAAKSAFTPPNCPPNRYNGECHMNMLRKMQASFAWDWGLAAPSSGIWKPVIVELYDSARIRDVTFAAEPMDNYWSVEVMVHLEVGLHQSWVKGNLTVDIMEFMEYSNMTMVDESTDGNGELAIEMTFKLPKNAVQLWWPNGYGKQFLYNLRVFWRGEVTNDKVQNNYYLSNKFLRVGFRTVELVEDELEYGLSFYFRVNGVPMFMKGSNWIPASVLPERNADPSTVTHLLESAAGAHMNMLRVWGGGVYESSLFYELADTLGILIWHDFMFACAMYPVHDDFLQSVAAEVRQNVRRLQSHPSVAIWAANNENEVALQQNWYGTSSESDRFAREYRVLYVDVVKRVCEANDRGRRCLVSSPSNGRGAIKDNWISKDPQSPWYGDMHFYNTEIDAWHSNNYPRPRFVSEYGFQSFPSLGALQAASNRSDNVSLFRLLDHRQHVPAGNFPIEFQIDKHFNMPQPVRSDYLEMMIYYSQVSQAMSIKIETESYRTERAGIGNTMGALYWQLNDVWVAPSWSSIEFNGQFKILQNWAKEFLAPLHIIPRAKDPNQLQIFVVRDTLGEPVRLRAAMRLYHWFSFRIIAEKQWTLKMPANSARLLDTVTIPALLTPPMTRQNTFFEFALINEVDGQQIATNYHFPEQFKNCIGISNAPMSVTIASNHCVDNRSLIVAEVRIAAPAIFLYLRIVNVSIPGPFFFSRNGYIQTEPIQSVSISFANAECAGQVDVANIKVMSVNDFM